MRIRNRLLCAILGIMGLLTVAYGWMHYSQRKSALLAGVDRELYVAALMAHDLLPASYHDRIFDRNSVPDAEYHSVVDRFNRICADTNLEYLWSVMWLDGTLVFTSATSPSKDVAQGDHAAFLEAHTNPEAYAEAFRSMLTQYEEIQDKWGRLRVALVPFRDGHGRAFLMGASRRMSDVDAQIGATLVSTVQAGAVMLLIGALISLRLAMSLSRPIERVTAVAKAIANGHFGHETAVRGPREIESLGSSIAAMGRAIQARLHELDESRKNLHITLRSIGDAVVATDVKGYVLWMNPVAEALMEWPESEAVGQPLDRVFRIVDAHSRAAAEGPVARVLREGQTVELASDSMLIARDGAERRIADCAAPIRSDGGETVGVVLVFRDVTDQYAKDQALKDSERRYRELFEHMSSSVVVCDAVNDGEDFVFRDLNRAATESSRVDRGAVVGKSVREAFPEVEALGLFAVLQRVWRTGQSERLPATVYAGRRVTVWFDTSVFRLPSGEIIAIIDDVTGRKRAEAERENLERQVQQAQKLESLGVLAGGIAHDFNNLLVAILGNADLALTDLPASSAARSSVQEIVTASRRAAELCKQMLAYSGRGRFCVEPLDLSEVVSEMTHMLDVSISKKAILKYRFTPNLPPIMADATQMRQVVMNLIINASEAIGARSGVISVATGAMECDREYLHEVHIDEGLPEGLYVTLEVSDTGCGMDEATRARIFDPFFTTKFTGRGLGLAAVLGIVRGHRGAVKVYSEEGKGSTFKVLLPATPDADLPGRMGAHGEPAEQKFGGGTVLLVDDEENVRALAKRMLVRLGFDVLTANDGLEALPVYRENANRIVCVILDMTMPHMDGAETFRELRRIRSDVHVLLSSGYNEAELAERFAGKGLAGFLQKPYTISALGSALRKAL